MHPTVDRYAKHVNPAFVKLLGVLDYGRVWIRAEGAELTDASGKVYLDFLASFGAANIGHNPPRLKAAIEQCLADKPMHLCHIGAAPHEADLAERLAGLAPDPLDRVLFASGGGEAVEAALKLARAATRRPGFVYARGGFHGTGFGTLSVMGETRMRAPFEPLLDHCREVPFGDVEALVSALDSTVAGVLLEPIQSEAGVVIPDPGAMERIAAACRNAGALLLMDEVQTGIGRTGQMFASEVVPDVLILGKSLGGGVMPVSAAITSSEVHDRAYGSMDRFDLHSSTYGGNALGCAIAQATLDIVEDGLLDNARARGEQLIEGLRARLDGHPFIRDIRGRGLLVGIEVGPTGTGWQARLAAPLVRQLSKQVFGQWAAVRLLEAGIVCQPAAHAWNVLKLEPPLTVTAEQIDRAIDAIAGVFEAYPTLVPLLRDVTARVGTQALGKFEMSQR